MRVIRMLVGVSVVLGLVVTGLPASSAAPGTAHEASSGRFYLALGDSVAAGFQPNRGITNRGYVDDLWRSLHRTSMPDLRLHNVACPGETSHSLISGAGSLCYGANHSQLDAALAFIQRHDGAIALVTIDIGANDLLDRCVDGQTLRFDRPCVADLMTRVGARVAHIVRALRDAVGPDVPIVGMNYYNPFLGVWALLPGGHRLARSIQRSWTVFNDGLERAYTGVHTPIANVANTFRIGDFGHPVVVPGLGEVPLNVAIACRRTWFCSPAFTGDPHPHGTGYLMIARAFRRVLERSWDARP
jgi:lysophospholipase L1-like esterase